LWRNPDGELEYYGVASSEKWAKKVGNNLSKSLPSGIALKSFANCRQLSLLE